MQQSLDLPNQTAADETVTTTISSTKSNTNCCIKKSDINTTTSPSLNQLKMELIETESTTVKCHCQSIIKMDASTSTTSTDIGLQSNFGNELIPYKPEFVCSLYITACPTIVRPGQIAPEPVHRQDLEDAINAIKPSGSFKVTETKCGLIAAFTNDLDAENLLLNSNLAEAMHRPVQVARFSRRDTRYKQVVTLRDVPWSIPIQDICMALTYQGISYENVDRFRNNVRVEVLDANHYETLISQGLNFFEAARFIAIPDRWYRNTNINHQMDGYLKDADSVLQCYRCQGFWHVAANCRHLPRCVRCGEAHGVEFCPRPRNNPICCHCSGAHHAAYRNCPVRMQLINAIPVSMSLSTTRSNNSREVRSRCRS